MVFHTALLLIKKIMSQQKKGNSGPTLFKFTGLTMFPTILGSYFGGTVEWTFKIFNLIYFAACKKFIVSSRHYRVHSSPREVSFIDNEPSSR